MFGAIFDCSDRLAPKFPESQNSSSSLLLAIIRLQMPSRHYYDLCDDEDEDFLLIAAYLPLESTQKPRLQALETRYIEDILEVGDDLTFVKTCRLDRATFTAR